MVPKFFEFLEVRPEFSLWAPSKPNQKGEKARFGNGDSISAALTALSQWARELGAWAHRPNTHGAEKYFLVQSQRAIRNSNPDVSEGSSRVFYYAPVPRLDTWWRCRGTGTRRQRPSPYSTPWAVLNLASLVWAHESSFWHFSTFSDKT